MAKKTTKLKNPTPKLYPSGKWRCQVTIEGKRRSVWGETDEIAYAKAIALKSGIVKPKEEPEKITLNDAILAYMSAEDGSLSPSTIRGYEIMRKNRFQGLINKDVHSITRLEIQREISEEAKKVSAKTIENAWGLLRPVLKDYGIEFENIKLPQKIKKQKKYLSSSDIAKLIEACEGDSCEVPILLAVWMGMRRSEISGLCWDCVDIEHSKIIIRRTMVPDKNNKWVLKEGAKNESSQRTIQCPFYIMEKIKKLPRKKDGLVFEMCPEIINRHLHKICKKVGILDTTLHGLRHANAAVMVRLGIVDQYAMARNGWKSNYTFKQIYAYVFPEGAEEADTLINNFFENCTPKLHTEKIDT